MPSIAPVSSRCTAIQSPVTGDWIAVHRELTGAMDGILGPTQKPVKASLDAIAPRINEAISSEPKG